MREDRRSHLAGMSLEALRDAYRRDLFEDYLPFWDQYGIDHELGGFTCALDHDGTRLHSDKHMWYQGRGLWVYSHLYRLFGDGRHLEVARKTCEFLRRCGRDEKGDWVVSLDREGRVVRPATRRGYGTLFVAEGLQEYARAAGDEEALQLALDSLWRYVQLVDDPRRHIDESYIPHSYVGMRTLGSHMVLIRFLSQVLEELEDPGLEKLADRVVEAVVERFWNPEYRLLNEVLDHEYRRPDDANEDFIYLGHAIETLWMLLHEARRRGDSALFELAAARFKRHVEVAWDDVYEGVFRALHVHGSYTFDKVLWAQEEVLIGCMLLLEQGEDAWAEEWFARVFRYVREKFSLRQYGYPLLIMSADRKVSFEPHSARKGNYHRPRHLMINLEILERMLARGGAVAAC